ncbi:hypothetical protein FRX31_009140 [Thalictrum thalictroides]|uniref:Uncharacterized protein n=1 Tax=Thalictrum thalictroides TaxID=46969 RepID=A0A7J6WV26_THATH|nr:hypothetical protein FRX31_009140 [Thalictrum thalictroides]
MNNQAAEDSLPSQFRVSSELGLAALQQTSLASNELQREVPIQFGSFKACPRHKEQPKKGRVAVWLQRNKSHDSKGKEKEQLDQGENKGMAAMIEKRDEPDLHDKNERWELPKKRHTCRARGDSLGSPKGIQVEDNNKGKEVSMGSLGSLARNKALHEKETLRGYRESPNRVDMGQDPGSPV